MTLPWPTTGPSGGERSSPRWTTTLCACSPGRTRDVRSARTPAHRRTATTVPHRMGRCQLGWGSAGSGRAGAGWAACRWYGSGCGSQSGDLVPDGESSGHLGAIVVSGEPMAAGPEMRGDHAEHRQEPVGCAGGAEAFHGAFALPGRLVRVLRPVVQLPRLPVLDRRHHRPMRHRIASELVGDQHPRYPALLGQQLTEEPLGGLGVPARSDQDVEDVAVPVDGPPQILPTAGDRQEHPIAGATCRRVGVGGGAGRPRRRVRTWRTTAGSSRR